ncbi:hypothetical protein BDZ94DRAFT_1276154, partial [Collybia nuda]
MKSISIVTMLMTVTLASALAAPSENTLASILSPSADCKWSGTAPVCRGSCGAGTKQCATSSCGDGVCCTIGVKILCCTSNSTCPAV